MTTILSSSPAPWPRERHHPKSRKLLVPWVFPFLLGGPYQPQEASLLPALLWVRPLYTPARARTRTLDQPVLHSPHLQFILSCQTAGCAQEDVSPRKQAFKPPPGPSLCLPLPPLGLTASGLTWGTRPS